MRQVHTLRGKLSGLGGGGELQATLLIIPAQVQAASVAGGESLVVGTVAAPVSLQLLSLAPSTVWTLTALNGTDTFPVAIDGQLLPAGAAPLSDALDSVGAQQVSQTHNNLRRHARCCCVLSQCPCMQLRECSVPLSCRGCVRRSFR
jgi:hypothetical protein